MAREQGRQWVDDFTVIQLKLDVSVIPSAEEAHRLFAAFAVHFREQIDLHYKMQTVTPHAFVEGQIATNASNEFQHAEGFTTPATPTNQFAG